MNRIVLILRTILSLAFLAVTVNQMWYMTRLWHDLMDRAVYMLNENTITTSTAGVLLSVFGGAIALLVACVAASIALRAWPWTFAADDE